MAAGGVDAAAAHYGNPLGEQRALAAGAADRRPLRPRRALASPAPTASAGSTRSPRQSARPASRPASRRDPAARPERPHRVRRPRRSTTARPPGCWSTRGDRRRPARLARPDALHAAGRGGRPHGDLAVIGPWRPARPASVPWPSGGFRSSGATRGRGAVRADTSTPAPPSTRRPTGPTPRSLVDARRSSAELADGRRPPGTLALEALRIAAWRPRAAHRGRRDDDPARARLAALRRAPSQGLLPRAGDGREGAQPRAPAAPARACCTSTGPTPCCRPTETRCSPSARDPSPRRGGGCAVRHLERHPP